MLQIKVTSNYDITGKEAPPTIEIVEQSASFNDVDAIAKAFRELVDKCKPAEVHPVPL